MAGGWMAEDQYGPFGYGAQPTATPTPDHAGEPTPFAATDPRRAQSGLASNPVFVLVVLLGVAALLIQFSVRIDIEG